MQKVITFLVVLLFSSHLSYSSVVDTNHVWGLTIDAVSNLSAVVTSLQNLCKKPTTRIVFDEFVPATNYQTAVTQIHNVSFIMGEILDSYYMNQYTLATYAARTNEYVNLLGDKVDIWEVGNEVNGEWLGITADVIAKIDTSYKIIKSKGKKTAVTLYYNKDCWENSKNEMFYWVNKNMNANLRNGLDYVWISYYEDDCNNLQPVWQQVFDSLHVLFPNSKIGIGECGTTKSGSKAAYINRYYKMNITTPNYVGGYFWWYFKQDCVPYTNALWTTFNNAISNSACASVQASQISYTPLSSSSISMTWVNGNGSKKAVFVYYGITGTPAVQDGFSYTANQTYGLGMQDGNGWYCVYNGPTPTAGSIVINGLTPAQFYRVMVLEYNGNPGFEGYNKTSTTNNPINVLSSMPVELISFVSTVSENLVRLKWITASEMNNAGFDIERTIYAGNEDWKAAGYVRGKGNSSSSITYDFTDNNLSPGKYKYRLKQTDFNGNFTYYNLASDVSIGVPSKCELSQNYPNPFNPTTNIKYQLTGSSFVKLVIYDMIGREVVNLVNEQQDAGYKVVEFDARNLSSGVYYYKITAKSNETEFLDVKKMLLVK